MNEELTLLQTSPLRSTATDYGPEELPCKIETPVRRAGGRKGGELLDRRGVERVAVSLGERCVRRRRRRRIVCEGVGIWEIELPSSGEGKKERRTQARRRVNGIFGGHGLCSSRDCLSGRGRESTVCWVFVLSHLRRQELRKGVGGKRLLPTPEVGLLQHCVPRIAKMSDRTGRKQQRNNTPLLIANSISGSKSRSSPNDDESAEADSISSRLAKANAMRAHPTPRSVVRRE